MRTYRLVALSAAIVLAACGNGGSDDAQAAASPAPVGPHATAVTRHFAVSMNKLEVEEHKYVDGIAVRVPGGGAAILSETPLDECRKLAAIARAEPDFAVFATEGKPSLVLVKNEENPKGAVIAAEPYMTSTLEESVPGFTTDGAKLVFKGELGDAGWGQIDATKYGAENSAHVVLDVELPYATMPATDPAADTSEEAKWLHDLSKKLEGATDPAVTQAEVEAALQAAEGDYRSSGNFFELLGNWKDPKVTAVARGPDCATLVVGAMSFTDKPVQSILHTRMIGGQRKVVSVVNLGDD